MRKLTELLDRFATAARGRFPAPKQQCGEPVDRIIGLRALRLELLEDRRMLSVFTAADSPVVPPASPTTPAEDAARHMPTVPSLGTIQADFAADLRRQAVEPGPTSIFYDYVEGGVLKGGRIDIDKNDPYHTAIASGEAAALWNVVTIIDNGPTANRIDLVFVGDGYTSAELGTYASHVSSVLPTFFGELPLDAYSSFFNVHRVDVISNESGVDHDPTEGIYRDTALDMGFWCSGIERLLCVNVSKALTAAGQAPDVDQVLAVANSTKYGGAGFGSSNLGTLAGGNSAAVELTLHEFGHSFADLADEYDFDDGATYTGPEPVSANVSIYDAAAMAGLETKWHLWLDEPNVDTFEGARYSQFGIYRPTSNSKMRGLNRPFEQINVEQFVLSAYKTVQPIDDATALGTYPDNTVFFVDPVDPTTHTLDVQWYLDAVPIPGAVGTTFDASSLDLAAGSYALTVEVVDNTSLVRDEALRNLWMTEQRTWTLEAGGDDFGDAPSPYPTLLADDGARHDTAGPMLGTNRDSEADGRPDPNALGDDTTGSPDDEDGLNNPVSDLTVLVGTAPTVDVTVTNNSGSAAMLYGWIDYNGDGVFDNATERASIGVPDGTTSSTVTLNFPVVAWLDPAVTNTYARFRLSTDAAAADPTGAALDGEVEDYTVEIQYATIADRHIFYDNSVFDGNIPEPNPGDDAAIATDKTALLPGETAAFANYTSYPRGINGIMVDIQGLADPVAVGDADFGEFVFRYGNDDNPAGWSTALDPVDVDVRDLGGGVHRVTITWADNAIGNKNWLQVTVKKNYSTGLGADDVFYFGNSIGENTGDFRVHYDDAFDNIWPSLFTPGPIGVDHTIDINRDGRIDYSDVFDAVWPNLFGPSPLVQLTAPAVPAARLESTDVVFDENRPWEIELLWFDELYGTSSDPEKEEEDALEATGLESVFSVYYEE